MTKLTITEKEMLKDLKKSHEKYIYLVKKAIKGWSLCSNYDFLLYIEVLRLMDLIVVTSGKTNYVFKVKRENLKYLPTPETVSRIRRFLNSRGLCLPTNKTIRKMRMRRSKVMREFFRRKKK